MIAIILDMTLKIHWQLHVHLPLYNKHPNITHIISILISNIHKTKRYTYVRLSSTLTIQKLSVTAALPSVFQKDLHIPLCPTSVPGDLSTHYTDLSARLTDDLLNKLRAFITVCRGTQYSVNEDIQKVPIQPEVSLDWHVPVFTNKTLHCTG